jgi:potassium-transporting ATPase KdpC subunit
MTALLSRTGRQYVAAVRALLLATLVLGLAYPLVVTGLAQVLTPGRADGSLVEADGAVVGSSLIGQAYSDADGNPLPQYFQPRPSASEYDGAASGGSNLGPNSPELAALIEERRAAVAAFNGVAPADVPPDAVTASGSGLDPDISPAYAAIQVDRVAAARHPIYRDRYQRTKTRLGRQRGASVARVDIARRLTEDLWHMLTTHQPFAPAGATPPTLAA